MTLTMKMHMYKIQEEEKGSVRVEIMFKRHLVIVLSEMISEHRDR